MENFFSNTKPKHVIENIPSRSDAVNVILSRKPGFIERWALLLFIIILLIVFGGTWFIKYSDTIEVTAILTSANTPKEIVSRMDGRITKLFVDNEDSVHQNDMIGWVASTGNHLQVMTMKNLLDSTLSQLQEDKIEDISTLFAKPFQDLGELQISYQQFFTSWQQFNNYLSNVNYFKKKKLLKKTPKIDKQEGFDKLGYRISQQKMIFDQAFQTMISLTDDWIKKHIIKAPIDGIVIFVVPLRENQLIESNEVLGFINPINTSYYAQVTLPQSNLEKIEKGQSVQLRFAAYPYQEFGYIVGKLSYISKASTDSGFIANIKLINGLTTNYKKDIPYKSGLKAQALIMTKETRLLQSFYHTIIKGTGR